LKYFVKIVLTLIFCI